VVKFEAAGGKGGGKKFFLKLFFEFDHFLGYQRQKFSQKNFNTFVENSIMKNLKKNSLKSVHK
jgi:hypothetical protein